MEYLSQFAREAVAESRLHVHVIDHILEKLLNLAGAWYP